MFRILLCSALLLLARYTYTQPPCCSGGGSANVSLGGNAESMMIPKGVFAFGVSDAFWFLRPQDDTTPYLTPVADVHFVNSTLLGAHYGLAKNLSLSVLVPYIQIRSDFYSKGADDSIDRLEGTSHGLGDITFMGKYQLPIKNGRIPKIALIAGIEIPSGFTDQNNGSVVASMGSKTWDPTFGIGIHKKSRSEKVNYVLNTTYKITPKNKENVDFGDFWNTTFLVSYKLNNRTIKDSSSHQKPKWFKTISGGLTNDYLFRQTYNDLAVFNTGYSRLYGSVGGAIGYKKRMTISAFGDVPLFEKVRGAQNKSAFRLRLSILITLNNK